MKQLVMEINQVPTSKACKFRPYWKGARLNIEVTSDDERQAYCFDFMQDYFKELICELMGC